MARLSIVSFPTTGLTIPAPPGPSMMLPDGMLPAALRPNQASQMSHELNVTIKQLKALVAVYKSGSFTSAADALHVTQSALSVLIKDLEINIGTRLFNRTSRRVEPTKSGRQLIMAANRMLSELECAVRNARDAQSGTQQLILGCPPMAAATFVPEIIADLRARAPNLRVVVRDIRPDEIAEATIAGELDLGLGSFGEPPSPLARSVIAHQDLVLIASSKNPLSSRKLVTWSDLRGAPLIQIAGDTARPSPRSRRIFGLERPAG